MSVGWVGAAAAVGGALISADASRSAANSQADSANAANATQRYFYDTTRNDNLPAIQRGNLAGDRIAYLLGLSTSGSGTGNTTISNNNLIDTSGGTWAPNATLYANSPSYKAAYDQFIANHRQQFGVDPSNALGSDINSAATQLANNGFDLNAYNAQQQSNAEADPAYGSFTKKFTVDDLNNDVPYQQGFQYALDQGQLGVNRLATATGSLNSGATLKALQDRAANVANQYAGDAYNRWNNDKNTQYNMLAGLSGAGQNALSTVSSTGANTANQISGNQISAGNARGASAIAGGNSLNSGISNGLNFYNTNNLLSQLSSNKTGSYMPSNSYNLAGAFN